MVRTLSFGAALLILVTAFVWMAQMPPPNDTIQRVTEETATATVAEAVSIAQEGSTSSSDSAAEKLPPTHPIPSLGVTQGMQIGGVDVQASVAQTMEDRIQGLSDTPGLLPNEVKLFVFEDEGPQAIWMKDMLYPIDIIWLDRTGVVVHIAEAVAPDTYPQSFASPVPARYVIETVAGFARNHGIAVGDTAVLPEGIAAR